MTAAEAEAKRSKPKNKKHGMLTPIVVFLAVIMPAVLVLLVPGDSTKAEVSFPPLSIYVASDLHYLAPELTDNGEYFMRMIENSDAKAMEYSEEIIETFVGRVIVDKPDYLILTGDITFNGEKASHIALAEKLKRIEDAGIQVLTMPGNHDLYSDTAASFHGGSYELVDSITSKDFQSIYNDFGFSQALATDDESLSYVYELSPDLWMLVLDVNTRAYPGSLTWDTYDWIKSQLDVARANDTKVIAASHQNLLLHNPLFVYDYLIAGHNELTELYDREKVICNLSGHMHIQHIAASPDGLTEIAGSALSVSPCQFGIIRVESNGLRYHTEALDFPHAEEAALFMSGKSYATAKKRFPQGRETLWEYFTRVNDLYFSGRGDLIEWNDDYYREMTESASISGMYLETILEDGFKNHTEVSISF